MAEPVSRRFGHFLNIISKDPDIICEDAVFSDPIEPSSKSLRTLVLSGKLIASLMMPFADGPAARRIHKLSWSNFLSQPAPSLLRRIEISI